MKLILIAILLCVGFILYNVFDGKKIMNNVVAGHPTEPDVFGVENKNPLNIRYENNNPWNGELTGKKGDDRGFCVFSHAYYGYRAAGYIILNDYAYENARTLSAIINKWAPPSENNTTEYIRRLCAMTGFSPDTIITRKNIAKMFHFQTFIESGADVDYPISYIQRGINLVPDTRPQGGR